MCGIVGFTGNRHAAPILLDGLSKLEYRGYDSAELAVRDGENLVNVNYIFKKKRNLMFRKNEIIFFRTLNESLEACST